MNTGPGERREGLGATPSIEHELAAAMAEFAGRERPPHIDPEALVRTAGRGPRLAVALAAVVAVAAALVTVVVADGGSGGARPVPPAGPTLTATPTRSATAPTAPATTPDTTGSPVGLGDAGDIYPDVRALFTAAMRYENPATRSTVDLAKVRSLFSDGQTFTRVWGDGGLEATCGQRPDGLIFSGPDDIRFYRGTAPLPVHPVVALDLVAGRIGDVSCMSSGHASVDPAVAGRYGPLVTAGGGPVDCGRPRPRVWVADEPGAGTTTHGWTVRLDDGKPFKISVDGNGKVTPYQCGKGS